jgi:hypothetical protein
VSINSVRVAMIQFEQLTAFAPMVSSHWGRVDADSAVNDRFFFVRCDSLVLSMLSVDG